MAGLSGTQVYEAAVALRPELAGRFVFMSGDVLNPELRQFAEAHGVAVLAKPFDIESVGRTVWAVLGDKAGIGAADGDAPGEPEGQPRG
jgi:hypothetical protein